MSAPARLTEFGFDFGSMTVERTCELDDERVVVTVKTPFRELSIYASRTGRSLRVFERGGGELHTPASQDNPRREDPR